LKVRWLCGKVDTKVSDVIAGRHCFTGHCRWSGEHPWKAKQRRNELQEVTFSLTRLPENPRQYSLVVSDNDEHTISGNFSIEQLQILKAIMIEAEKFALSGEAVGTRDSITTRFADNRRARF